MKTAEELEAENKQIREENDRLWAKIGRLATVAAEYETALGLKQTVNGKAVRPNFSVAGRVINPGDPDWTPAPDFVPPADFTMPPGWGWKPELGWFRTKET